MTELYIDEWYVGARIPINNNSCADGIDGCKNGLATNPAVESSFDAFVWATDKAGIDLMLYVGSLSKKVSIATD